MVVNLTCLSIILQVTIMSYLFCRTTSNLQSFEDDEEHIEEVEDWVTMSDSSQSMSPGKIKETKVTPGKNRCMSKTVDPMEEKLLKPLEITTKESPKMMQNTCFV